MGFISGDWLGDLVESGEDVGDGEGLFCRTFLCSRQEKWE